MKGGRNIHTYFGWGNRNNLVNNIAGMGKIDIGCQDASILSPVKSRFFIFLSLHHQNNRLENSYTFNLPPPPFNSVAKKAIIK
jgi:hypothetical protein